MYRYFIQPQLNKINKSVVGYELLIRQQVGSRWVLPEHFSDIPIDIMVNTLLKTTSTLSLKVKTISVNLNRRQILDPLIDDALIRCQQQIQPLKLVIEVTEEPGDEQITSLELLGMLSRFWEHGMEISLDDVGSGNNHYEQIKNFLPIASELKFALQNFDEGIENMIIQDHIKRWQKIAANNRSRFMVEGIETSDDEEIASSLGIKYCQGYYYGKPHLLRLD
ncbi:EAL domain-containing protein [Paucilactobacillus suebicus]|uniref:C-di-GMP-specific phosphodiesterase n=1 Tax=Paucilactobacillus suebicus DSM 5007 = KCTC 3549 TaxID=1423807 RepID=A0A0R1W5T8_9LACO|nr:EAL domain-containing protein [Paucilactobacillus suebicus]KRM12815.1 C-di-GMP-specific phosphodiesterase [Paucilactobacillus suebicus DSM 5007 = KCTC 3549]